MAGLALVTAPAIEPITVAQAKLFARIDITEDDQVVNDLVVAARHHAEEWSGRSLLTQTWDVFRDNFPILTSDVTGFDGVFTPAGGEQWRGSPLSTWQRRLALELPRSPLQSVVSVTYTPANGSPVVLDPSTYQVDTSNVRSPRIAPQIGKMWPADLLQPLNGVVIRIKTGYGDRPTDLPEHFRLGIRQLVAFWYQSRDAGVTDIPEAINNLFLEAIGGFSYA